MKLNMHWRSSQVVSVNKVALLINGVALLSALEEDIIRSGALAFPSPPPPLQLSPVFISSFYGLL